MPYIKKRKRGPFNKVTPFFLLLYNVEPYLIFHNGENIEEAVLEP